MWFDAPFVVNGSKGGGSPPCCPGDPLFARQYTIVHILDADQDTDSSKVDLEAVRQHLIDMNEITLKADADQQQIEGGLEIAIAGRGDGARPCGRRGKRAAAIAARVLHTQRLRAGESQPRFAERPEPARPERRRRQASGALDFGLRSGRLGAGQSCVPAPSTKAPPLFAPIYWYSPPPPLDR
jgi:hypothetical protein